MLFLSLAEKNRLFYFSMVLGATYFLEIFSVVKIKNIRCVSPLSNYAYTIKLVGVGGKKLGSQS